MSAAPDALSRYPRAVALGAAALSALHFFSFFDPKIPIYTDIRYFVYFAWRIAEGAVPHLDLFDNKTFGSTFVGALFYRIGNTLGVDELEAIRLGSLAVCALGGWGVFLVFRRLDGGRTIGGLLGLFAYLAFGFIGAFAAIGTFPKLFMSALALAAAVLVRRERWLWAGVMGGLAFMDWQIGALVGVGAGVAALLSGPTRWRPALLVITGGVLCLVPVVIYYLAHGALDVALEQTVFASIARSEDTGARFGTWDRVMRVWGLAQTYCPGRPWLLIVALPGFFIAPAWAWRLRGQAEGRMLIVLCVYHSGIVAFSLLDFQRFGDFFLLLQSMAFFLGVVFVAFYREATAGLERFLPSIPNAKHALVAIVLLAVVFLARPAYLGPDIKIRVRPISPQTTLDDQRQIAAQVLERTSGQRLVMVGASELLFLMRYVNPLPFVYFNTPTLSVYGRPGESEREATIRVILSTDPDAFILPGRRRIEPGYQLSSHDGPRVPGYAREIVSTPKGSYGVVLYARDTLAAPGPEL